MSRAARSPAPAHVEGKLVAGRPPSAGEAVGARRLGGHVIEGNVVVGDVDPQMRALPADARGVSGSIRIRENRAGIRHRLRRVVLEVAEPADDRSARKLGTGAVSPRVAPAGLARRPRGESGGDDGQPVPADRSSRHVLPELYSTIVAPAGTSAFCGNRSTSITS